MNKNALDVTQGPVLKPLIAFSLPIMFANILQLLFNAADIIVVGQFVDETAVAAIGSTLSIISILVSLFAGLSIGVTVVIATYMGAGNKALQNVIQTAYTLGLISGVFTAACGFFFSPFVLSLMNTPDDVIGQANIYLRIYFLGQPGFMIYTFSRAILAAKGDTKSPSFYIFLAGVINVVLNIFLVTAVKLGVAGVAIATITSQYLSGILTLRKLVCSQSEFHVSVKKIFLDRSELRRIINLGLPTGIQSTLLSISGILIQSSFNSLGTAVIAGQSASNSIMSFIAQSLNAFSQGCMTFTGQNYGGGNKNRIRKVYRCTLLIDIVFGAACTALILTFGKPLLRIYVPDSPESVNAGLVGIRTTMSFAILMGIQDASGFVLRGMNRSVFPMVTAIIGNCIYKIIWIYTVFYPLSPSLEILVSCRLLVMTYPLSWVMILVMNTMKYLSVMRNWKEQTISPSPSPEAPHISG